MIGFVLLSAAAVTFLAASLVAADRADRLIREFNSHDAHWAGIGFDAAALFCAFCGVLTAFDVIMMQLL